MSASSGAASACATTSGPMPRGSPRVTARRRRCVTPLGKEGDVVRTAQIADVLLDGQLLAHLCAEPFFDVVERHLTFGLPFRDVHDGELRSPRRRVDGERWHATGDRVLADRFE